MPALTTAVWIAATILAYGLVHRLYVRYNHPLFNVVVLSAAIIIAALMLLDLPFAAYEPAKDIMTVLIGGGVGHRGARPAAVPVLRAAQTVFARDHCAVAAGAFIAMISAAAIC